MRYLNARNTAFGEDRKIYSTVDSTATAGQTVFNVAYDQGRVAVFLNGIRLVPVQDYTYTLSGIGSSITLGAGITANDYLELIGLQGINAGNVVTEDNFVVGTASTGSGGGYTNSTTVFPVSSSSGDLVSVWRNGIKLVPTTDFTVASNASTVTLQAAANASDEITVHVVGILQHSNFVQTTGGTFTGTVAHTGTLNVSGGTLTTSTAQKQAIVQAGPGSGTLDVSSGTLTTSTAQKTAIVDGGKGNLAKSDVGLGNVDNESKATMFTSPTFTGTPTVSSSSASYSPTLDINNSNAGAYGGILKFTAKAGSTTYTPAQVRAYGGSGASDGRLAIETAGTERLRIDQNGNVGIGLNNPSAGLHLYDDRDITNNPNDKGLRLDESAGKWLLSLGQSGISNTSFAIRDVTNTNYPFIIDGQTQAGNRPAIKIDSAGKVLIANSASTYADAEGDDLVVGNTSFTATGVTICASSSGSTGLFFSATSSGTGRYSGAVTYDYGNRHGMGAKSMFFRTNTSIKLVLDTDGHLFPALDNNNDCGTSAKRWRNIYTADLQLSNVDTGGNDIDGTEGSWTIQEGSEDLYIINRQTGKKFKFNLIEV